MVKNYTPTQLNQAKILFDYLAVASARLPVAEVIIGFGHFDLNIPRHCGALFSRGLAPRIIFTGGIGSGTADLGQPEAVAFAAELARCCPQIPAGAVILEQKSTNTSENIQFTAQLLAQKHPEFTFGPVIKQAIIVANAYRQRRVLLTCQKNLPQVTFFCAPPAATLDSEILLYAGKSIDFVPLLTGEIDRLIEYGRKGFIVAEPVPASILQAHRQLTKI